jgi:hypothetical protein
MLPHVTAIIAMSYATKTTIALLATFFVLFPVIVHALLGVAAVVIRGERQENEAYEEQVTARR